MSSKTLFLRLTSESDKATSLEAALAEQSHTLRFEVASESFELIPGAPFAYWVSEDVRQIFRRHSAFEIDCRHAAFGLSTKCDFRFLRLYWETPQIAGEREWHHFAKGGSYSPCYSDVHLVLFWKHDGNELKAYQDHKIGGDNQWSRWINSVEYYFRPGLTWSRRTQKGLSLRAMSEGCIFADKGPAAFVDGDDPEALLALLAVMNSAAFRGLVSLQMAFGSFEVGVIQRTPVPSLEGLTQSFLAQRAKSLWSLKQKRDQVEETSHVYLLPALLMADGNTLAERTAVWNQGLQADEVEIQRLQTKIDEKCWGLYGIPEGDQQALVNPGEAVAENKECSDESGDGEDDQESSVLATPQALAEDFTSWLFGMAIGRWDSGLATGETPIPPLPGPFDKLPAVSRGMLIGTDGLHPAKDAAGRFVPDHDLLVDDEGHDLDLLPRMLQVLSKVAGPQADDWLQELEALLGTDLRTWIRRTYFERHLKRHSKSRRKAPLYWQLGTSSGSYSVWLYYPRLTKDSLYRVLHEVVKPKVSQEEQRLTQLRQAQARRSEVEAQETLVEELRAFQDEVARVTPLFDPNLDDGVLLNFAPLWRLTAHNGWRKDTKAAWEALVKGDYDWAHLALKLWPERVIPKCAKERHLALAHALEGPLKTASVEKLIEAHLRPAVKEALAQLQAAPALGSGSRAPKISKTAAAPRATKTAVIAPLSAGDLPEAVLKVLAEHPQGAAKTDVFEATGLDAASWNAVIARLLASGQVRREGEKRGTRYFRIERN